MQFRHFLIELHRYEVDVVLGPTERRTKSWTSETQMSNRWTKHVTSATMFIKPSLDHHLCTLNLDTYLICLFLSKDGELRTKCRKVQFRHFLIELFQHDVKPAACCCRLSCLPSPPGQLSGSRYQCVRCFERTNCSSSSSCGPK